MTLKPEQIWPPDGAPPALPVPLCPKPGYASLACLLAGQGPWFVPGVDLGWPPSQPPAARLFLAACLQGLQGALSLWCPTVQPRSLGFTGTHVQALQQGSDQEAALRLAWVLGEGHPLPPQPSHSGPGGGGHVHRLSILEERAEYLCAEQPLTSRWMASLTAQSKQQAQPCGQARGASAVPMWGWGGSPEVSLRGGSFLCTWASLLRSSGSLILQALGEQGRGQGEGEDTAHSSGGRIQPLLLHLLPPPFPEAPRLNLQPLPAQDK